MGKLSFEANKFYFKATAWSERGGIATENQHAKDAGFIWDADSLRWETRSAAKAVKLRWFADSRAEQKLKTRFITENAPPEQILYPDDLQPLEHQMVSALWCCTRTPAYCADEAGLGKTITACLCMNTLRGNTTIICPAYLIPNWILEIRKWCPQIKTIGVLDGKSKNEDFTPQDVVLCSDSMLTDSTVRLRLRERRVRWLFVDEAHRFKEATAKRTQALVGGEGYNNEDGPPIVQTSDRVVLMSGTPLPNGRPIELYHLLSQLSSEAILHLDAQEFGHAFCGAKPVTHYERGRPVVHWDFKGASNLKKLRAALRSKLMIRHLKSNVLKDLPPKTRKIIFLDEVKRLKSFEQRVLKNYTLDELMGDDYGLGDIATYRREVGEAKIIPAFTYLITLLDESPEKLVVFAQHIEVVEKLTEMLSDFHPLKIRGGMTAKQKSEQVRLFQTEAKHRVIIGNMEAMGVGNTLTRAPGVVIVEPDWRPGANEQAEDRVHRMTQNQNVYVRYLVLRESLDERMLTQVLSKQDAINQVME